MALNRARKTPGISPTIAPTAAPKSIGTTTATTGGRFHCVAATAPASAPRKHAPSAAMLNIEAWNMMHTATPV